MMLDMLLLNLLNEAYQNKGIMKRTLFNIFDIFKEMHPESEEFMLQVDQI